MSTVSLITVLGAVALLLYGLEVARTGLQSVAGARLRPLIGHVTRNRWRGLASGVAVTALTQSSAATTVMLVGFTSAGLLNLSQAAAVILGADVGSTITVQLIALNIQEYALAIVALGFALSYFGRDRRAQGIGSSILGFGFIFFSLKLVSEATEPLRTADWFQAMLAATAAKPLVALAAAALLAAVLQSGAATIGLLLVLAQHGQLAVDAAVPLVLGANIGASATPLLASVGGSLEARRVAIAHLLFKLLGAAAALPLLGPFADLVAATTGSSARQIANAHTLFNVALAAALLPFTPQLARLVERLVPDRAPPGRMPWHTRYLDAAALESPPLALALATREAARMGDVAYEMYRDTVRVFVANNQELLEDVERRDDWLDHLNREIKLYLTKLSSHAMTEELSGREMALVGVIADLENIGDVIQKNLLELAKKKIYKGLRFSDQGLREIVELHGEIGKNFEMALSAFASADPDLAQQVVHYKSNISQRERELRAKHIQRLHQGLPESIETSAIHLDALSNLVRINHHVTGIAHAVIEAR